MVQVADGMGRARSAARHVVLRLHDSPVGRRGRIGHSRRRPTETLRAGDTRGVRFYAGASLLSEEGYVLGTLCAMDCVPRGLTAGQTNALSKLARQVMSQLKW